MVKLKKRVKSSAGENTEQLELSHFQWWKQFKLESPLTPATKSDYS